MIDLHTHVLPGLDDGAHSVEEAVEMLRLAKAAGTTDIVASPHANMAYRFDPATVEKRIAELQQAAPDAPRIHYGCDFHLTRENIEDAIASPGKYSIGHRGYLLVEFSDFLIPKTTTEIFDQMLQSGLRPVITHPERNRLLQRRINELEEWVGMGCRIQVTGQSLLGRFGRTSKAAAHDLVARGMSHFLASDAHDPKSRPPRLDETWKYAEWHFGTAAAQQMLQDNPSAALAGEPVALRVTVRKRRWYAFG